jgi:hypothetical protein
MADRRFVNVVFEFKGEPDYPKIQQTLDKARDWVRYAPNCWLLWTTTSAKRWYDRLKDHLDEGEHLFICEVNVSERGGFMPRSFWEFIRSHQHTESKD